MHQSAAFFLKLTVPTTVDSVPTMHCCLAVPPTPCRWPVQMTVTEAVVVWVIQMARETLPTCWPLRSLTEYCCVAAGTQSLEVDSETPRSEESDSGPKVELSLQWQWLVESCSVQLNPEESDSVLRWWLAVSDCVTQLLVV